MTPRQQAKRMKRMKELVANLKRLEQQLISLGKKGKQLNLCLQCYASGWSDHEGGAPDPIIYFAILRGGKIIPQIEESINNVTKTK